MDINNKFKKAGNSSRRILSILLSTLLLIGLTPSLSFGADISTLAASDFTLTLKTDTSGKLDNIKFFILGTRPTNVSDIRTIGEPIDITSTDKEFQLRMDNRPDDLLAYTVSVGGISLRVIPDDIIDSPPKSASQATLYPLGASGLFSKITTRAGGAGGTVGNFVTLYFDNSGDNAFGGLNIDVEFIFIPESSTYTATTVESEHGTASAIDLNFNRWNMLAKPALGYEIDYWQHSADGNNWTKDESSVGERSIVRTLSEDMQYRAVFASYGSDLLTPSNPTHAAIIRNLGNLETAVLEVGEHKYTVKREKRDIILIAYEGPNGNLEIPHGITEIGARDVKTTNSSSATSVFSKKTTIFGAVIAEGVSAINDGVFYGCTNLTAVSLPDTLTTIGNMAFYQTGLTEIEFPERLNNVGSSAFNGAKIVEAIMPLATANGTLEGSTFANCTELQNVIFPENTMMKVLPQSFVNGCKSLTNFTIPESVVDIGTSAFNGSGIEHIVIPKNVKTIGASAFYLSQLTSIEFLGPSLNSIGNNAFRSCSNLEEVAFPYEVGTFGTQILDGCLSLETIVMPDVTKMTTFGSNFFVAGNLKTIIFPQIPVATTLNNTWLATSAVSKVTIYTREDSNVEKALKAKTNGWQNASIKYLDSIQEPQVTAQNGNDLTFADAGLATDWRLAGKYDYSLTVPRAEGVKATDVTALDALFAAHEAYYGKETFTPENYTNYLQVDEDGYVTRAFGTSTGNTYCGFVNGVETEDLAAVAVTDRDTVHISYGKVDGKNLSSHYSFTRGDGVPTRNITMMPETDYTLTVAADGSGSPVTDAAVYAAFRPAGKDVSGFNQVGTTGSDGKITLRFTDDKIGGNIVYAKKAGYAFAPLHVTVQGADARLGSIVAVPDKPFETLTKLESGYDAGTLMKAGASGEDVSEGFDPDHYTYNYYVNSNTERLDFGVTANYADSAEFMTIAAIVDGEPVAGFTAAASDKWSAIPVTLAPGYDSKTPVTFDITYKDTEAESGQVYTQSYTVNVVKSENSPFPWLLDEVATGRTRTYGVYNNTSQTFNATMLFAYKGDATADAILKISKGNKLYIDDVLQETPIRTSRFGAYAADEYDIKFAIPQDLTGKNPNSLRVTSYAITVGTGSHQETHNLNINLRSLYDGVHTPDRVTEYQPTVSQHIRAGYVGNPDGAPVVLLQANTHYLSTITFLGGFGGYITAEYDDPIKNDAKNPYGVDFIVYGNAFEGGKAAEPASVEVSENGTDWYYIAGSHHYELNALFDQKAVLADSSTVGAMKLDIGDRAGYPNVTFGYGDVSSCSDQETNPNAGKVWSVTGEPYNPYNGDLKYNIGDGFDLSWAVDKNGKPVQLDSIKYIRLQNIIDVKENGAFGEISPEINTIIRTRPQDQIAPIDVTSTPASISIGGKGLDELAQAATTVSSISGGSISGGQATYYEIELSKEDAASGVVPVSVTGAADDNIYVNATRGVGSVSYNALLDSDGNRTVRVIAQNGEKQARIYVFRLTGGEGADANADLDSIEMDGDAMAKSGEAYTATVVNRTRSVSLSVKSLNPAAKIELKAGDGEYKGLAYGAQSELLALNVGENRFTVKITSGNGNVSKEYPVVVTRSAASDSNNVTVAVSVEKFTVDGGYIIEPALITVPKGSTAAYTVMEFLKEQNPGVAAPYRYSNSNLGFYLQSVWDPGYKNANAGYPGYLSEVDEGEVSGWMYTVGNEFPLGAGSVTVNDGDVMRWQYSREGLGKDIGAPAYISSGEDEVYDPGQEVDRGSTFADKDELTWMVAEIRTEGRAVLYGSAYTDAMAVLKDLSATKGQIDAAVVALKLKDEKTLEDPATDITVAIGGDALPAGTAVDKLKLEVEPIASGTAKYGSASNALADVGTNILLYDISLLDTTSNKNITQLNGDVIVSIPVPPGMDAARIGVYRMEDDGKAKQLPSSIRGDMIVFNTDHFSLYAIVEKAAAPSPAYTPAPSPQPAAALTSLATLTIKAADKVWNGKKIASGFVLKAGGKKLSAGKDYTVASTGANKNIGVGTVKIAGKGVYTGTSTVKFKIVPKAVKLKTAKAGKSSMSIKWTKAPSAEKITRYEVRWKAKGAKNWSSPKQVSATKATYTAKKLTKGKKYDVQARAYKTVKGIKYYSAWSAAKPSAKVK